MPRSTISNRHSLPYDKDLELRASDAAALSATGSTSGLLMYPIQTTGFRVIIETSAYTSYSAGTAEWSITVGVAATSGGTYYTVGNAVIPPGTAGRYEIGITGEQVEDVLSTAKYIRTTATKTGSPGTLSYTSRVVPLPVH